jgi:arabinofuranan 3-O-arabinosyltransferase
VAGIVRTRVQPDLPTAVNLPGRRGRLVLWIVLGGALVALPFLSLPGRYVFDARDSLWFHPATYLVRSLTLWRSVPYMGLEQHDGILFPMGVSVWGLRALGVPVWVAERLWHGALLLVATAGTVALVDELRGRRTLIAPFAAGLIYTLTPYTFGYGLPFSPLWLPYALLPLLLLVVLRGIDRPGLAWPATFGLVTLLMGGGNGAPQMYVLLTAAALIAWLVLAERRVPARRALRFALWSAAFFVGLNAYWLFLLKSPEVFNALKFTEQPNGINIASSASESIRGLGYWQFYGGDAFGSWSPTVRAFITNPLLLATGYAVVIGAILSAWLVRWRYRLFFVLLGVVAVFVAMGVFPVGSPSPFGHLLLFSYNHVPGVAGLRTTYKVTAQVNLSLAILAGIGLEAWHTRVARLPRSAPLRAGVVALAIVVIGTNAFPLWTGHLYDPERSTGPIPSYWKQALSALDRRDSSYRAFFVPSTSWTTAAYTWGAIKEHIDATDPSLNAVDPIRLPVEQRYGTNLIAALEEPYLDGAPAEGTAQLLRYLGVRDVVLQNDIDWERSRSARPAQFRALLRDPDLRRSLVFGKRGHNVLRAFGRRRTRFVERYLRPVEVLTVRGAVPPVRPESPDPVILSGDGFGIASAARAGLLASGPPILYSGALGSSTLAGVLRDETPRVIVTDSNRRRVWYLTQPRAPRSTTLPANQTIGDRPVGFLLFGDRLSTQTVASYPGLRSITSSVANTRFGTNPQFRPANAFDGNPTTWWLVGSWPGAWIQADFAKPQLLSSLSIAEPGNWWLREIRRVRITFSDGSSVAAAVGQGRKVTVRFPPRLSSSIRITLTRVGQNPAPGNLTGAAISDIEIPGLDPAEVLEVPHDLFQTAARTPDGIGSLSRLPFTYLFERARSYYVGGPAEEAQVARRFDVAGTRRFVLGGSVRLNRQAGDDVIDTALFGRRSVSVTSSSRLLGSPAVRGSAAFDGDRATEWVPSGTNGEWIDFRFPSHLISRIVVETDTSRGRMTGIRAVFPDGSTAEGHVGRGLDGTITLNFPPKRTRGVALFVDGVFAPLGAPKTVGIEEVRIPGVRAQAVHPSDPLPCSGSFMSVDGRPVPVRPLGTVGELLSGVRVPIGTCEGYPLTLGPGSHVLRTGGGLQANVVTLSTAASATPARTATLPHMAVEPGSAGSYRVDVTDARGPYYLVVGQNYDPLWRASIGGEDLGPPMVLDGYALGWRVDRPGSYRISVWYGKQRRYDLALLASAASLVAALVIVLAAVYRRRHPAGRTPRPSSPVPAG